MSKAALVVGGNLAGLQAALDMAAAGIKVYLVEESPFLGNNQGVAQHELTAKMLAAVKHPNVEIITCVQVTSLSGQSGDFQAILRRHSRYVDLARCTACGDCVPVCPITIPVDGVDRKAIFGHGYGAVPNVFAIEKRGIAPCRAACPADIHVQGYVALIAQGRFQEALDLIGEAVPFPGVLGRVCHHPCEEKCRRATEVDEAVSICALKRFVADESFHIIDNTPPGPQSKIQNLSRANAKDPKSKIAIVGAGPAGLSAAYFLAKEGVPCDVFETLPVAGGMMAVGIPSYRLPRDVLQREIAAIEALGVTIHLNHPVDAAEWDRLRRDYAAIFIAVGAHKSQRLGIEGENLDGVLSGIDMLHQANLARYGLAAEETGRGNLQSAICNLQSVVVLGGGNVAIDSAMTARRLGAREVTVLYRRTRAEMPANPWETAQAEEEGIQFHYLAAPVQVVGQEGRVAALECIRMELGQPDASGRRRPVPIPGSGFALPCDTVITAVGQAVACGFEGVVAAAGGTFQVDPLTLQTGLPGVFAGGDAVSGPASVVEAIAAGRRAAESIRRYLHGQDLALGRIAARPDTSGIDYYTPAEPVRRPRALMPHLPLSERIGFAETALGFNPDTALAEAQRCLSCGICAECLACVRVCQPKAIQHDQVAQTLRLDVGAVLWGDDQDIAPEADGMYVLPRNAQVASAITARVIRETRGQSIGKPATPNLPSAVCHLPSAPRLGVFICRCGDEIGGVLDVDALVKAAQALPGVTYAQDLPFSCHPESAATIHELAARHGLERVILAACSCCSLDQVCYGCTYQRVRCKGNLGILPEVRNLREGSYPIEFVNVREQCAWVHQDAPELAADKAGRLIAAAVARGLNTENRILSTAVVDAYRCRTCGDCQEMCEVQAIKVKDAGGRLATCVDALLCTGCGVCAAHCPSGAITAGDYTDRQIEAMLAAIINHSS